jgi:asparagine synthase (glutamine-hydrolysing)
MCGIAGLNREDRSLIEAMTNLLAHRGPDQEGYYVQDGVSLGHKRLSILDLSEHGRQPLANEDRTIWAVHNGEIFNFPDLKKELSALGHVFSSHTDTEVLVHGYEQWGCEILRRLNGQFAFCLFDRPGRKLFLARDRFGIKPLYYAFNGGLLAFGSELKAVLQGGVDRALDETSLNHYLYFGYMPTGRTIFRQVRQLPPAHFLLFDLARGEIEQIGRYWELIFQQGVPRTEASIVSELAARLRQSVQRQMISDVPLGAFLSGGVDSSILVSLMRDRTEKLKTFSIRFDYPEFNESRFAQIVSDLFRTDHYEIQFSALHVRDLIDRLPFHYDEPFADPSMIPTWLVCSVARREVTVCLSGTGGDELFGGYPRYREFMILKRLNRLPGWLRKILDGGAAMGRHDKLSKLRTFLQQPLPDDVIYQMLLSYMFRRPDEKAGRPCDFDTSGIRFDSHCDLENLLSYDMFEYLPNCLLPKEDRASMAFGLEVRVPFLDHEFAEFTAGIPADLKLRGRQTKYILKKAFASILPAEILNRRKQGFGVPLVHYFRKELKTFAAEILFSRTADEYFDRALLEDLWNCHQSGASDYARIFWSVMMFQLWYDRWMR